MQCNEKCPKEGRHVGIRCDVALNCAHHVAVRLQGAVRAVSGSMVDVIMNYGISGGSN